MNSLNHNGIDVSVTVNGRPVRTYLHEGRYFIESREGTEYVIEVKNHLWHRVEAVVAVDGLSVMNGQKASVEDYGYVIPAYGSIKIKGYRKDLEEVGSFKFTRKEKSYAAADKGDGSNVGVIAVAVWKEKVTYTMSNVYPGRTTTVWTSTPTWAAGHTLNCTAGYTASNASYTSGNLSSNIVSQAGGITTDGINAGHGLLRSCSPASFDHGTTWGKSIEDKVTTTSFERDGIILQSEIFYNSKENLEAMGIKLVQEKQVNYPTGFPGSFAKPPTEWKG
jgi:hypothetical protein